MRYFGGGGSITVINEHLILLILQMTWLFNGECQRRNEILITLIVLL